MHIISVARKENHVNEKREKERKKREPTEERKK
jgi:hypothetical protein